MSETTTWTVAGTTDDVTTCDLCGKIDLHHTVRMVTSDNEAEMFMGSDCAARMTGRPAATIRKDAAAADREAARARRIAQAAAAEAERAARAAARVGQSRADALAEMRASGRVAPFMLRALERGADSQWAMYYDGQLAA